MKQVGPRRPTCLVCFLSTIVVVSIAGTANCQNCENEPPSCLAAYLADLPLIAHYPMTQDGEDVTGRNGPLDLTNAPFEEGGVRANGGSSSEPMRSVISTPRLDSFNFSEFAIGVQFKISEYSDTPRPIFVAGPSFRWLVPHSQPDSTVNLKYNNRFFTDSFGPAARFETDVFHHVLVAFTAVDSTARLFVDSVEVGSVVFPLSHGSDPSIGNIDGASGDSFRGVLRELRVYAAGFQPFTDCTQTQVSAQECKALLSAYESTSGENWNKNSGWLQTSSPCSWFGVGCNGGSVSVLDMRANGLTGSLPPELGQLDLDWLELGINDLTGPLPEELGNLSNLRGLRLDFNRLTGTVPLSVASVGANSFCSFANNETSLCIPDSPEYQNLTSPPGNQICELTPDPNCEPLVVGIEEDRADLPRTEFSIGPAYPNPFESRSSIQITVLQSQLVTVDLLDVLGRRIKEVFRGEIASNVPRELHVAVGQLPAGLYFLDIRGTRFATLRSLTVAR